MLNPLVSVVIPTHDRGHLISRAVESALAQTYEPLEVIVVDDGSADDTAERLDAFDGRIRSLLLPSNVGGAAARNRGIEAAGGDLIAFLDSDDEWLPKKLELQVPLLLESKHVGAVYCRHYSYDDATGRRARTYSGLYRGDIRSELLRGRCPRTVSLFVVRTSAVRGVGGFDENLRGFQDTDLWLRLSAKWHFDAADEELVIVHNHEGSRVTTDMTSRQSALDSFLSKWGTEMARHMPPGGVEAYRRNQLAVAQGALVLSTVRAGRRLDALAELRRYTTIAKLSNPRQLLGLLIATLGGPVAHRWAKAMLYRFKIDAP